MTVSLYALSPPLISTRLDTDSSPCFSVLFVYRSIVDPLSKTARSIEMWRDGMARRAMLLVTLYSVGPSRSLDHTAPVMYLCPSRGAEPLRCVQHAPHWMFSCFFCPRKLTWISIDVMRTHREVSQCENPHKLVTPIVFREHSALVTAVLETSVNRRGTPPTLDLPTKIRHRCHGGCLTLT